MRSRYDAHGLVPNEIVRMTLNKQTIDVWAIPCVHSIPTNGYG